jgi:predicted enzyme related to lactoylglutathione lyase
MSSVTHFEIYAEEPVKLADFYRGLFGWPLDKVMGVDYWRIQTGPTDASGFDGGLTYRPIPGLRSWVHYVNVESLDEAVAKAQHLGAEVLRPKTAVPKTAWYALLADPEGNVFAIWQADPTAFPPRNRINVRPFPRQLRARAWRHDFAKPQRCRNRSGT